jgi:hypothetical protein
VWQCARHEAPNTSGNGYFGEVAVAKSVFSQRGAFKAGTVMADAVGGFAALSASASSAAQAAPAGPDGRCQARDRRAVVIPAERGDPLR